MKIVHLIHNPTAGDEAHSREKLTAQIESAGYRCRYSSTKEPGWKNLDEEADIIAIAGGDGTVRKVVRQALKNKKVAADAQLTVLPLGTANNISKTLNLGTETEELVHHWENAEVKRIDIGRLENVSDASFFLEGFGFGIFPQLMKEMKQQAKEYDTPEDELQAGLKTLHRLLLNYKPRYCKLEVDGTDHSGKFYLVEVMNIRSIGPNIELAPLADPSDGEFEVVLIPESQQEKFSDFLLDELTNGEDSFQFHTLKGKTISIEWDGCRYHADDKLLKLDKVTEVKITVDPGALQFLLCSPGDDDGTAQE